VERPEEGAPPADAAPAEETSPDSGAATEEAGSASEAIARRPAPVDGREPRPNAALPEIRVRHIGLHIGGGPNDEPTRRPILRAIEAQERRVLGCYRLVERPLRGGVYGADLFVPGAGGAAQVRATRQKLGAEDFDACMRKALEQVRFPKPPRPTVVSYSLRFDVVDASAP
jgi:hypothetical protein